MPNSADAPDVTLPSRRLLLRRFRAEDVLELAGYRSDPAVARYQSWSAPLSVTEAAVLVDGFAAGDPRRPGWFQYALERIPGDGPEADAADRGLVGDLGVRLHENPLQAEVGITVAAAHQGRGYAAEALGRVLEHLFVDRELHKVSAECDARNLASSALLRRLGFFPEGHRRAHTYLKGEWTDDLLFGLLARDWST